MEQNQNTNEQLPPKEIIPLQIHVTSDAAIPQTPPAPENAKEELPTHLAANEASQPQQTDSMEVHKHPHHVMHKKKWPEYLLEFFMLFLAVFLGFIAENIRERYAEKKHEKEFALQLSEGLKQDTAALNFILAVNEVEKRDYDSLLFYMRGPDDEEKWKGIYRHIQNVNGAPLFVSHQVSFEQIQNIGALRYFRNQEIVRQLTEYKYWIGVISFQQNLYAQFSAGQLEPFLLTHFSEDKMLQRFQTRLNATDVSASYIPAFVLNRDQFRVFQNLIVQGREKLLLPQGNLKAMQERAVELIDLLDKEYRFKNE